MPKTRSITRNEADIALRAYQIWEAEGKPDGKDFDFWLRAEAELSPPAKKAPAKKAPAKKAAAKKAPAAKPAARKTASRKASPKKP